MSRRRPAAGSSGSVSGDEPAVSPKKPAVSFDNSVTAAAKPPSKVSQYGKPATFWLLLIPYCIFLARWTLLQHYALPTPLTATHDDAGLPQFSEARSLSYIRHYSEDIGYRILGTPEMDRTVDYTLKVIDQIKSEVSRKDVEIEVSLQKGSGHHLFDFMDKKVWKKYIGISNVVVRLSDGTPASKENAILVNAHLDSTLPSPGAADDAAGVAVMLEALRIMGQTPDLELNNAIVFLFNGAEESLQDASHLFITQHEWKDTIRAVVNLEAAGTAGAEMLFQATSTEMIKAFAQAPRPHGAVLATEVFATGVILSDTDFRQFVQYGSLTGLDMAIVRDSYKYHTRLDTLEFIEPGTMQHFGENIVSILSYLATVPTGSELRGISKSREVVFFDLFGGKIFVSVHKDTATLGYVALFVACLALAALRMRRDRLAGYIACLLSIPASIIGSALTAVTTAAAMAYALDKPLSYFRKEWWCLVLYGPSTVLGIAFVQYLLAAWIKRRSLFFPGEGITQHALLLSIMVFNASFGLAGHLLGMLSSYLLMIGAASMLVTVLVNDFFLVGTRGVTGRRGVSTLAYLIGQTVPIIVGSQGIMTFLDVIVPLTGRTGADAPSDIIIAVLVSVLGFLAIPTFPALCHRWGQRFLSQLIIGLLFAAGVAVSIFAAPSWRPFDATHPKRMLCLYMENITSKDLSLHVANLDPSTTIFQSILANSTTALALSQVPIKSDINDDIPDWDIIYPISQFLQSYKVPLPALPSNYVSPFAGKFRIEVLESSLNAVKQTRHLRLAIRHPEIIWTVIAFTSDVISWDLPSNPERGQVRHHVKEASGYGIDTWELSMTIQLHGKQFEAAQRNSQRAKGQRKKGGADDAADRIAGGLRIDFSGLDVNRMWHHRSNEDRPGMDFVKRLDAVLPDWTDPMLLTAVAGVEYV